MAIYIPGWAEGLLQSGDLRRLGGAAVEKFAPDLVANRKLQALVQQNPMLLSQIENMTPEARAAMEQTLGFKKQTPLQGLPVGAELSSQMEMKDYIKNLTPAQRELRLAAKAGTKTPEQISREDKLFQQNLQNGNLQNQILTGQVKDLTRVQGQIDASVSAYPDLKGIKFSDIAKAAIRGGQQIDSQLMTRIQSDVGAKTLYDAAYSAELNLFKNELDKKLALTKNPADQMQLLRVLTEIGNQLNDQQGKIILQMQSEAKYFDDQSKDLFVRMNNPTAFTQEARKKLLERYDVQLEDINKRIQENREQAQKLAEKYGGMPMTTPTTASPPPASAGMNMPVGPTVDAEARLALDAIRQKPQDEMRIRAAYKQRTGRDLP